MPSWWPGAFHPLRQRVSIPRYTRAGCVVAEARLEMVSWRVCSDQGPVFQLADELRRGRTGHERRPDHRGPRRCKFGDFTAVASLQTKSVGEIFGLSGSNGAGKTNTFADARA